MQEHDFEEALRLGANAADKAILLAPDDAEAYFVRARIHTEAGELEQALARYDQAIALNPSNSEILESSSAPLLFVGRIDQAIDRIERAMGIDPFHPDWYYWDMGWALYEKNDCEAALTAIRRMPKIPTGAHRMLAGIYACLGKQQEAREALAVFLKDSPGDNVREHRKKWGKLYTDPDRFERWAEDMRFAGLPE